MLRPLQALPATWQSKAVSAEFENVLSKLQSSWGKSQTHRLTSIQVIIRKEFHISRSMAEKVKHCIIDVD